MLPLTSDKHLNVSYNIWFDYGLKKEDTCTMSGIDMKCITLWAQINASQSSSNRHISTSTVQRRLCESGIHGRIAAKKPSLKYTNKNNRLGWAKKHELWTLDRWKFVLWSRVQIWDFSFQPLCLCETQCGWTMISAFVFPTQKACSRGCYVVGVPCWWHCLWFIYTLTTPLA